MRRVRLEDSGGRAVTFAFPRRLPFLRRLRRSLRPVAGLHAAPRGHEQSRRSVRFLPDASNEVDSHPDTEVDLVVRRRDAHRAFAELLRNLEALQVARTELDGKLVGEVQ